MMEYRIGIDVGGTFTDFLVMDDAGGTGIYKILSSPDDPSRAVMEGLARMAADRGNLRRLGNARGLGQAGNAVMQTRRVGAEHDLKLFIARDGPRGRRQRALEGLGRSVLVFWRCGHEPCSLSVWL